MVKRDKNTEAEENIFLPIVEMLDGADGLNENAYSSVARTLLKQS